MQNGHSFQPVLTKKDFVERFQRGEFGNKTRNWDTVQEFLLSDERPQGPFHLRNRIAGGPTWYDLSYQELVAKCQQLGSLDDYYVAEMAPTDCTVFQGEVYRSEAHLSLYYSVVPKPMRDSLREGGRQVEGLTAKMLLAYYLDPCDYDWLQELLDRYENHVVEFSHYSRACGTLNRRMIVWEVRRY